MVNSDDDEVNEFHREHSVKTWRGEFEGVCSSGQKKKTSRDGAAEVVERG